MMTIEWNGKANNARSGLLRVMPLLVIATVAACDQTAEDAEHEGSEETVQEEASGSEASSPEPEPEQAPRELEPEPEPEPASVAIIPQGTRMIFEVEETVSTDTHAAGDEFMLRLTEDVHGVDGALIPAGATARGVVTEAERSGGSDDEAILAVEVHSLHVQGEAREVAASIEGADMEAGAQDSGTRSAAKVATGAAAGAIIGQVLGGDTRSTAQGAAAGAAAGAGVAFLTRDGHAVLGEGARLEVRLDEPFQIP